MVCYRRLGTTYLLPSPRVKQFICFGLLDRWRLDQYFVPILMQQISIIRCVTSQKNDDIKYRFVTKCNALSRTWGWCECGNEHLSFVKICEILDWLSFVSLSKTTPLLLFVISLVRTSKMYVLYLTMEPFPASQFSCTCGVQVLRYPNFFLGQWK